ncbi:MAG: hypothetical protein RI885_2255 [Actinomycetota bacterium]
MRANDAGRITLSWAQLVWGITVLVVLVGGYKDLKTGLAQVQSTVNGMYTKAEVDQMRVDADRVHAALEAKIRRIESKLKDDEE